MCYPTYELSQEIQNARLREADNGLLAVLICENRVVRDPTEIGNQAH